MLCCFSVGGLGFGFFLLFFFCLMKLIEAAKSYLELVYEVKIL